MVTEKKLPTGRESYGVMTTVFTVAFAGLYSHQPYLAWLAVVGFALWIIIRGKSRKK